MFIPQVSPWFRLSADMGRLAYETQALIGLRLFRIATGTAPITEIGRMVPEKASALAASHAVAVGDLLQGEPEQTPKKVVKLYRRRVKANKKRLSKGR